MTQPRWCGYPGCKVTGECGYMEFGPCPPEDSDARKAQPGDVWEYEGVYYEVQPLDQPNPVGGFGPLWAIGYNSSGWKMTINRIAFLETEGRFVSRDVTAGKGD